jgi:hypothetical protein
MKSRLFLKIFVLIFFAGIAAAFLPVNDYLPHPQKAIVQFDEGRQIPVRLSVWWYDQGLNTNSFGKMLDFDAHHEAQIPKTPIPTLLWRLCLKRTLTPFDKWTACENCYGPNVLCSLRLNKDFQVPEKMRLVQSETETNSLITFRVSLIPNESKYETREFKPSNVAGLLVEAKILISEGNVNSIPSSKWGSELTRINPVRAECQEATLILWMGGKVGYVLVPDSTSCPAFNMAFVMGTEHPHIFKLEKM